MAMSADMTPRILANIQILPERADDANKPALPQARHGLQPRLNGCKSVTAAAPPKRLMSLPLSFLQIPHGAVESD
jgi:hypothetical protein